MEKKKSRSTRIVIISTVIIIALLVMSVFSLYAMADSDKKEGLRLADPEETEEYLKEKASDLLSVYDEDETEYVVVTEKTAETVPAVESKDDPVETEPAVQEVQKIAADLNVVDSTVNIPIAEAEEVNDEAVQDYEENPVSDTNEAYETPEYDMAYTEETYEEPVYAAYISDDHFSDPAESYDYDDSYDEADSEYYSDGDNASDDGEWIYDYDADEWVYVYNDDQSYDYDDSSDSYDDNDSSYDYDDSYDENDASDDGEWVYDYDADEWRYVYNDDQSYDYDDSSDSYDDNDESYNYDDAYDEADTEDYDDSDNSSDDGEWVYDYDLDEWVYVYGDDTPDDDYDYDSSDDYYEEDDSDEYVSSNTSLGQQIVDYAMSWVGVTPYVEAEYRWTGNGYYNSLTDGTDCSGFTHLIYGAFGIYVPTGSDEYQYNVGTQISYDDLLPGDIVVYRYGGHVAIYAGNDMIIHCANPSSGTVYSSMWYSSPTAYVRVVY